MPRRRNPPAGTVTFEQATVEQLVVHELTAGIVDGVPDDNAEHLIHGLLVIDGADDTIVLDVRQHARVQGLLDVARLRVGLQPVPDTSPYDDPYPGYEPEIPYPDITYDETYGGYTYSQPEDTGLTVDESGDVRTSGFVLIKNAARSVIIRAPNDLYYSFAVDESGHLATTGMLIGPDAP